jgi:hypothetical protein
MKDPYLTDPVQEIGENFVDLDRISVFANGFNHLTNFPSLKKQLFFLISQEKYPFLYVS